MNEIAFNQRACVMKLKNVFSQKNVTPPIWLMRQAGRYLPEYREIRKNYDDFLSFCYTPHDACTVTLQPIERFDLDAAIIFSDILVIPDALNQKVTFEKDHGPRLSAFSDIKINRAYDDHWLQHLTPVYDAIAQTRSQLNSDKSLIGFCGTPWTLACYMLEEGKSTDFQHILNYEKNRRENFTQLIDALTHCVTQHALKQIQAGCDVIQLFDSWAIKAPKYNVHNNHTHKKVDTWDQYLVEPILKVIETLHKHHPDVLVVYYSRCSEGLYDRFINARKHQPSKHFGLGIWHEVSLSNIQQKISYENPIALQGNLSPEILEKGGEEMFQTAARIVENMKNSPFIFNLGHGVLKSTPPDHVAKLVQCIRSTSQR